MLAGCGKDLKAVTTREQVRKEFGEPDTVGKDGGRAYEGFRFHGKLADPFMAGCYRRGFGTTLGLGECINFPRPSSTRVST